MLNKIDNIKETVRNVLIRHPETRDNDRILVLKVWAIQNPNLRADTYTFIAFSRDMVSGRYADFESIRRARQKLQEEVPQLRGQYYHNRKNTAREVQLSINA